MATSRRASSRRRHPDEAMRSTAHPARLTDAERFPALRALLDAGVFDRADAPDDEFASAWNGSSTASRRWSAHGRSPSGKT